MKYRIYYLVMVSLSILLYSCNTSDDDGPTFITTNVQGLIKDDLRNVVYSDSVQLSAVYACGSGFNSGVCYEFVAATRADGNGVFEFNFEYDTSKSYRVVRIKEYSYYEEGDEFFIIDTGVENNIEITGWRPIIFEVDVAITNNIFPDLRVQTRDDLNLIFGYDFPVERMSEQHIQKQIYVHGKPSTQMSISFNYNDDHTNNNYHERMEILNTAVQDTIRLSYDVDCSAF